MIEGPKFKRYSLIDLHDAPNTPGIYAWYGKLILGTPDWKSDVDKATGTDFGERRLRLALRAHSERFRPPPMQANSHIAFRDHWTGIMEASTYDLAVNALASAAPQLPQELGFPQSEIQRTMSTEKQRGNLAAALGELTPLFATPLYIGKSKTLRKRLEGHAQKLRQLFEFTKDDAEKLKALQDKVRHISPKQPANAEESYTSIGFPARAIAAGFTPDMLWVYVFETSEYAGANIEKAHDLACTLEWLANTWYRPLLGRK